MLKDADKAKATMVVENLLTQLVFLPLCKTKWEGNFLFRH